MLCWCCISNYYDLPRSVRFKRENVILVSVLPGPSEPKHDINTESLVSELSELWTGVTMQVRTASGVSSEVVRCALLCVACDLPSTSGPGSEYVQKL